MAASREAVTPSGKQERKCSASKTCSVLQEADRDKNIAAAIRRGGGVGRPCNRQRAEAEV